MYHLIIALILICLLPAFSAHDKAWDKKQKEGLYSSEREMSKILKARREVGAEIEAVTSEPFLVPGDKIRYVLTPKYQSSGIFEPEWKEATVISTGNKCDETGVYPIWETDPNGSYDFVQHINFLDDDNDLVGVSLSCHYKNESHAPRQMDDYDATVMDSSTKEHHLKCYARSKSYEKYGKNYLIVLKDCGDEQISYLQWVMKKGRIIDKLVNEYKEENPFFKKYDNGRFIAKIEYPDVLHENFIKGSTLYTYYQWSKDWMEIINFK